MRSLELCAGYGGLALAVEAVFGAETAAVAEWEQAPSKVLAHRFPGVPNLHDITTADWSTVGRVDVIAGGTPCQDLSSAGQRRGMRDGTRSGLWSSMLDAVAELRPSFVVWENVRGALSACAHSELEPCPGCVGDGGQHRPVLRAAGRVVGDLSALGYDAAWRVVSAAEVGAPHRRDRIFVVGVDPDAVSERRWATRGDDGVRPEGLVQGADAKSAHVGHERGRRARDGRPGLADGGESAADAEGGRRDDGNAVHFGAVAGEVNAPGDSVGAAGHTAGFTGGIVHGEPGTAAADTPLSEWGAEEPDDMGAALGSAAELGERPSPIAWGAYEAAIRRWERSLGRPAPAPTELGPKGGARLSPRFVEWMMGLDDGWVCDVPGLARNEMLKMLGNGVVRQQAAYAIRSLLPVLLERAV